MEHHERKFKYWCYYHGCNLNFYRIFFFFLLACNQILRVPLSLSLSLPTLQSVKINTKIERIEWLHQRMRWWRVAKRFHSLYNERKRNVSTENTGRQLKEIDPHTCVCPVYTINSLNIGRRVRKEKKKNKLTSFQLFSRYARRQVLRGQGVIRFFMGPDSRQGLKQSEQNAAQQPPPSRFLCFI